MIRILEVGPLATVQDLGRRGWGHLGVPRSGPVDPPSHHFVNRLVGNAPGAATIEILRGGMAVQFLTATTFALGGAPVPARLGRRPVPHDATLWAAAGTTLTMEAPVLGLWSYLAIRGGIDIAPQLGSRSTDILSGLGPAPLTAGQEISAGDLIAGGPQGVDIPRALSHGRVELDITPGPRADWFTPRSHEHLVGATWSLTQDTNRIAARLSGPALALREPAELPTEGIHLGSIQIPASGQPIVHLANHPPTGGYPVIAIVTESTLPRLAQAVPGAEIRFSPA